MDEWKIVTASYLEGEITKEQMADAIVLLFGRERSPSFDTYQTGQKENHIRLVGLNQIQGQKPTALHISIEEGGTLTDLKGKGLWSGFVSAESFDQTVLLYGGAFNPTEKEEKNMPPNKNQTIEQNKSI